MKTKIKTNTAHINNNTKKIKNWPKYNKSLKNRGNLSIFISEALVKDGSLDETQYTEQSLKAKIINKFNELGLPKYEILN